MSANHPEWGEVVGAFTDAYVIMTRYAREHDDPEHPTYHLLAELDVEVDDIVGRLESIEPCKTCDCIVCRCGEGA